VYGLSQEESFPEFPFALRKRLHFPQPVPSFPEFLFEWRNKAHYSQQELADRIGVDRKTVNRWERGQAIPNITNLHRIAKELHIPYKVLKPYLAALYRQRCQTVAPAGRSLEKSS
jgi:transcriptional regulator with XRE-family HTH domain